MPKPIKRLTLNVRTGTTDIQGFFLEKRIMQKQKPVSTYVKKLQDPRWQKLRLQALELSEWACAGCGSGLCDNTTLHVHHRQYFKGREPWEYEIGQLEVLCKDCHFANHEEEDILLTVCSFIGSKKYSDREDCASLLVGFSNLDQSEIYPPNPEAFLIGQIAATIDYSKNGLSFNEILSLIQKIDKNQEEWIKTLRKFSEYSYKE